MKFWTLRNKQEVDVEYHQFMVVKSSIRNTESIETAQQVMICAQEPYTIWCMPEQ